MIEIYKGWEIHPSYIGYGFDGLNPNDCDVAAWGYTVQECRDAIDKDDDDGLYDV